MASLNVSILLNLFSYGKVGTCILSSSKAELILLQTNDYKTFINRKNQYRTLITAKIKMTTKWTGASITRLFRCVRWLLKSTTHSNHSFLIQMKLRMCGTSMAYHLSISVPRQSSRTYRARNWMKTKTDVPICNKNCSETNRQKNGLFVTYLLRGSINRK